MEGRVRLCLVRKKPRRHQCPVLFRQILRDTWQLGFRALNVVQSNGTPRQGGRIQANKAITPNE